MKEIQKPALKFDFSMTEQANPAYAVPNDVIINRSVVISEYTEKDVNNYLEDIVVTVYRFLENCGYPVTIPIYQFYNIGCQLLRDRYGIEDVQPFFRGALGEEPLDENLMYKYGKELGDEEIDFEGFCKNVSDRGGYARKMFDMLKRGCGNIGEEEEDDDEGIFVGET